MYENWIKLSVQNVSSLIGRLVYNTGCILCCCIQGYILMIMDLQHGIKCKKEKRPVSLF